MGEAADARKILVVDDEPSIRESMAEMLQLHGYEVDTAVDGFDAIDVAERFHPDMLVLDVTMPRENGYRVSRALKSRTDRPAPRILIVTARRTDDDAEREALFLEFSMADGIMYKPFHLADLLDRIRHLLG